MTRPTLGAEHVEKLSGERETKSRLRLILLTLSGELSVNVAAEQMGVCPSRFHELRDEALMGALDALSPRPPGRRPKEATTSERVLELEGELNRTRYELEVERVRAELLLTMPEVVRGKARPPRGTGGGCGGDGRSTRR